MLPADRACSSKRKRGACKSSWLNYRTASALATLVEEKPDEVCDGEQRPAFVQETRERREARELPVGPAEELHQLVDRAIGAEDLGEEGAREQQHEREVDPREPRHAAQRHERGDARREADDAPHG